MNRILSAVLIVLVLTICVIAKTPGKYNVLFIISDDLTYTALSCYGNKVCNSLVELQDLYPTISRLCGLTPPPGIQGRDISRMLVDPTYKVREAAFSVAPMRRSFLLRTHKFAYIQYNEDASKGIELFDMDKDPQQFTNLAKNPEYAAVVKRFKNMMAEKLRVIRDNDLPPAPEQKTGK